MMSRVRPLWMIVLVACAAHGPTHPDEAAEYLSPLGFAVTLPDPWSPLEPGGLLGHFDETDPHFSGIDKTALGAALEKVRSGEFEFFVREPIGEFAQNIAVRPRQLRLPADAQALSKACAGIPAAMRPSIGRDIAPPAACEIRSVAGRHATYVEMDGAIAGTRVLQYQVQRSDRDVLTITATALTRDLSLVRSEFESIITSLRFVQ